MTKKFIRCSLCQLLPWVFYVLSAGSVYSTDYFFTLTSGIVSIIYSICLVNTSCFTLVLACSNASSKLVASQKSIETDQSGLDCQLFCAACESYVPVESKHCMRCNQCILGFDHHCALVNNCIGKKNYKKFVVLLGSALVTFGMSSVMTVIGITLSLTNPEEMSIKLPSFIVQLILWTEFFLSFMPMCFVGYLIGLHSWLRSKGLTTFEYFTKNVSGRKSDKGVRPVLTDINSVV